MNKDMIPEWQGRTELLLGAEALEALRNSHVLVMGLGGVGAYAAEMLCRAGIGRLTIVDFDTIHPTNRNRQLLALVSRTGKFKVSIMEERLKDINPEVEITGICEFIQDDKIDQLLSQKFDYVVDAIDTLSPKVSLIRKSLGKAYPIISSMGSGGKVDPLQVTVCDISESHTCKLAYKIRKQLHRSGITEGFKVVYSPEKVSKSSIQLTSGEKNKKSTVGTVSYMPSVFGCIMASVVIRDLAGKH